MKLRSKTKYAPLRMHGQEYVATTWVSTKWASYSTNGRLTFDTSLLDLQTELQEYVIAHELIHFHAPNHGKLWKSLMRAHLGNYEHVEGQLKRLAEESSCRRR